VFVNGSLLETVSAATLSFTTKAPKGASSYYVIAFDVAGNVSDPSNTVDITL
jgi:hypothetical protein